MENIKGSIVLEIKDFIAKNYKIGKHQSGTTLIDGSMLDLFELNSVYIRCKEIYPKTTKGLVKAILNSDFVDDVLMGVYE